MNTNNNSKHITSNTHIQKIEYGIVVEEYEVFKLKYHEVDDTQRDVTNMENSLVIDSTIIHVYMFIKSGSDGLNKKINKAPKNRFSFNELMKLTITIDSNLSTINIC